MERNIWPQNLLSLSEMSWIFQTGSKKKYPIIFVDFRAIFRFFRFCLNPVFHIFSLHTRWNMCFGQNPKNRKIALKSTKIVGYFFLEPFWKIQDISDGLERFWGQKIFSIVFKIAYYVNLGFSSIFLDQNFLNFWPRDMLLCPKITKISKSGFFTKNGLWTPLNTMRPYLKCFRNA